MEVSDSLNPDAMCLNDFRLRAQPIRAPPDGCSPLATGANPNRLERPLATELNFNFNFFFFFFFFNRISNS